MNRLWGQAGVRFADYQGPATAQPDPDIAARQCTQDADPIQRTDREGSVFSCPGSPGHPGRGWARSCPRVVFFRPLPRISRVDGRRYGRCKFQSSQSCSAARVFRQDTEDGSKYPRFPHNIITIRTPVPESALSGSSYLAHMARPGSRPFSCTPPNRPVTPFHYPSARSTPRSMAPPVLPDHSYRLTRST